MIDLLLVVLLIVVVILLVATSGPEYALQRIWAFQGKRFRRAMEQIRTRWTPRLRQPQRYRVDLREIRDLVISLQLGTSMEETLSGALYRVAEQFKDRGTFGERLFKHVETKLSIAPEEVIKGLAEDFQSQHLGDLVQRLEMARDGGISYERALSLSASQIEEEIRADLRRDIQRLPIQLAFPMVIGVFLPAVVIGMLPLVLPLIFNVFGFQVGSGGR